jgi:type I restriction enzyme, R subunit
MKFNEEKLEQSFIELLGREGYPHYLGSSISRKEDDVLIEEDLKNFLLKEYEDDEITENEVGSILIRLKTLSSSDLYESNKTFLRMLADGFIFKREDSTKKDIFIKLINDSPYAGAF